LLHDEYLHVIATKSITSENTRFYHLVLWTLIVLKSWKFWVGCALFIGLIWLVENSIGWLSILQSWQAIPPQSLGIALLLMLASYLLRAVRFYDFFQPQVKGAFAPLLRITVLHNFFNNMLPMRSGEAAFPVLMKTRFGIPFSHSAPALLWLRLLDLYALLALAFISLQVLIPWGIEIRTLLAVAVVLAPLVALLIQNQLRRYLASRQGWKLKAAELMAALPEHPATFIRALFWTFINWVLKLAVYSWLLQVFTGLDLHKAWTGATTGELSSVLPIHGVAGAGTYEAGVLAGLIPWAVDQKVALAAAVNLHLFVLGTTFVLTVLLVLATQVSTRENTP
jgi:uncharacterized membrane protein YbhN (UPF0104 family)